MAREDMTEKWLSEGLRMPPGTMAMALAALLFMAAGCSNGLEGPVRAIESENVAQKKQAIEQIRAAVRPSVIKKALPLLSPPAEELDEAAEALIGMLPDPNVGLAAVKALGDLRNARAVEHLTRIAKGASEKGSVEIRRAAVEALAKIGDRRVVPELLFMLEEREIRLTVIWALGFIGDACAVGSLNELLSSSDPYVRYNAGQALKLIS